MWAHRARLARSARCTSSATSRTGRPAAAHSTSRSAASNTRSRSSSGAATAGGGPGRPSARARSGASRPSSAGHPAGSGGGGTTATSARASSCHIASGASPPTSTPAPTATRAPALSARRASSVDQPALADPGLAGDDDDASTAVPRRRPGGGQRGQLRRPAEHRCRGGPRVGGRCRWPRSRASSARVAGAGPTPSSARSRWAKLPAGDERSGPVTRRGKSFEESPVSGLVERGQRAAPSRQAGSVGGVCRGGGEAVEQRDVASEVLSARGLRPIVVQPGARASRQRRCIAVADEFLELVDVAHDSLEGDGAARRGHGVGAQRPAQRPDGRTQVGPRGRGVRPEAGGQGVAVVRTGVQGEEREQAAVRRRERHRFTVARGRDLAEELHVQHPPNGRPDCAMRLPR